MKISRDQPLPPEMSVRSARDAYLAENGFTMEAYESKWTPVKILGIRFGVPNTRKHRWAIKMHDLHHVVTGYGTDLTGEAEISAWELRRGMRGLGLYVGYIVTSLAALGLVVAPRRTLAAYRAGAGGSSLYAERDADEFLDMTVGELRRKLGVPERGVATLRRGLNALAPQTAAG